MFNIYFNNKKIRKGIIFNLRNFKIKNFMLFIFLCNNFNFIEIKLILDDVVLGLNDYGGFGVKFFYI